MCLDFSVIFCGATGVGKSSAADFFLDKEDTEERKTFSAEEGMFCSVKSTRSAVSFVLSKTIELIDTPGYGTSETTSDTFKHVILDALNSAKRPMPIIVFVINIKTIFYETDCDATDQLLQISRAIPFIIALFTHAGNDDRNRYEAVKYIKNILSKQLCSPKLEELMQLIDFRVMMLDSENTSIQYKRQKSHELIEKVSSQNDNQNYVPFICEIQKMLQCKEQEVIAKGPKPSVSQENATVSQLDYTTSESLYGCSPLYTAVETFGMSCFQS